MIWTCSSWMWKCNKCNLFWFPRHHHLYCRTDPPLIFLSVWYLLLSSHVSSQDTFLPHVECGTITLIGATTENPSFQVNSALLSRCRVLVLEQLSVEAMGSILRRAVDFLGLQVLNGDASEICSEWVSVVPLLSQRVWDPSSDFTASFWWFIGGLDW